MIRLRGSQRPAYQRCWERTGEVRSHQPPRRIPSLRRTSGPGPGWPAYRPGDAPHRGERVIAFPTQFPAHSGAGPPRVAEIDRPGPHRLAGKQIGWSPGGRRPPNLCGFQEEKTASSAVYRPPLPCAVSPRWAWGQARASPQGLRSRPARGCASHRARRSARPSGSGRTAWARASPYTPASR
jgi:hypothetical protein